mgnify:CR=1 FL=1
MPLSENPNVREAVYIISKKFSRCSHKTIDYQEIAEDFRVISGARYVALNDVSDYGEYTTTKAIAGIREGIQQASKIFGFPLVGAAYSIDTPIKEVFAADGIVEFDHLCSLAGSQVPQGLCREAAKLFRLEKAYALAMYDYNGPIADLIFILEKGVELQNRLEIETLASVLSLCLQRVYAEQDMVLKLLDVCKADNEERRAAYQSLFAATDRLPDLIYHLDTEGRISFINQAVQRYGYTRESLIGEHILELVHPEDREKARWKLNERRAGDRRTRKFEVRLKTGDKHTVFLSLYNRSMPKDPVLLVDAEGIYKGTPGRSDFMGTLGVGHDITEQKLLQNELDQHSHMFRTIIENMGEAAWLEEIDPQRTMYLNPACERLFQITADRLQADPSLWLRIIHPDDRKRVEAALTQLNSEHRLDPIEYRIFDKTGTERWVRAHTFPVEDTYGKVTRMVGIAHDITSEQQERTLLQERVQKEKAFVHEINHRVKNNLTLLDSMLSLELGSIQEQQNDADNTTEILGKVKARIRAVGLVHEMLYSSSQDRAVEARQYLQELGFNILEADGVNYGRIQLEFRIKDLVWLPVRVVIPLGMIFSELLTNAIKYAFPAGEDGQVWVRLEGHAEQEYELQVCDNGKALPPDYDQKSLSIGHSLITSLARQLNGSFEIKTNQNYKCFSIRFAME